MRGLAHPGVGCCPLLARLIQKAQDPKTLAAQNTRMNQNPTAVRCVCVAPSSYSLTTNNRGDHVPDGHRTYVLWLVRSPFASTECERPTIPECSGPESQPTRSRIGNRTTITGKETLSHHTIALFHRANMNAPNDLRMSGAATLPVARSASASAC